MLLCKSRDGSHLFFLFLSYRKGDATHRSCGVAVCKAESIRKQRHISWGRKIDICEEKLNSSFYLLYLVWYNYGETVLYSKKWIFCQKFQTTFCSPSSVANDKRYLGTYHYTTTITMTNGTVKFNLGSNIILLVKCLLGSIPVGKMLCSFSMSAPSPFLEALPTVL